MHRIRFWARSKAHALSYNPFAGEAQQRATPLNSPQGSHQKHARSQRDTRRGSQDAGAGSSNVAAGVNVVDNRDPSIPPPAPPPEGNPSSPLAKNDVKPANIATRFYQSAKMILLSSWINPLLVFVPVGIALEYSHVSPTAIFTVNAIAIVPLASLLSFATESVARRMGDTIGALMNVTFGNAVELIIFILALSKNEIRIVQASLLGSILANLLLILGMCFLLGGLRYREQIYNSTATQISACLLCLSVGSLLLPTAFHASFTDNKRANKAVLKVSRGTSVILLLIYVLYLLFQLKSHAYMYASTPQARIDEESYPGVLANIMGSSSSSDSSSSPSTSDSDNSSSSNNTVRRIRKVMRKGRRRRKSSSSSTTMTPAPRNDVAEKQVNQNGTTLERQASATERIFSQDNGLASGDEADIDSGRAKAKKSHRAKAVNFQNVEGAAEPDPKSGKRKHKKRRHHHQTNEKRGSISTAGEARSIDEKISSLSQPVPSGPEVSSDQRPSHSPRPPFSILNLSLRPVMPKPFSSMGQSPARDPPLIVPIPPASLARAPYGIRRATSLPERLNQQIGTVLPSSGPPLPYVTPVNVSRLSLDSKDNEAGKKNISKKTAVVLLLVSTGLVALCAEFLVDSIGALVRDTGVNPAFVGLIILPIVGNAAEHVTAVTVAAKNKMDLAIGVALGSSIQIALFITPVIVLLGWILNKDMSLYFSLFETISLFASAFIVNFLVLDGRSNYLEGALLLAAYIIIGLASFFYPDPTQQSAISGTGHQINH